MQKAFAWISVLFGIIACLLVFTPFFKTPPLPIMIFAILGIVVGIYSVRTVKNFSLVGIFLSGAALGYLAVLFIQLGG